MTSGKLSAEKVGLLRDMIVDGRPNREIMAELHVASNTIARFRRSMQLGRVPDAPKWPERVKELPVKPCYRLMRPCRRNCKHKCKAPLRFT